MCRRTVYVIVGSVRHKRLCPDIAGWVAEIGRDVEKRTVFEVVDLRDWPLPMDDEPGIPALGGYASEATRKWSAKIAQADAFIFVTPQYNWGYPAALKNAIDHLYVEWRDKPAMIVSYGGHGGGKCAAQLQQVLTGIKMRVVPEMPALVLEKSVIEANSGRIDAGAYFGDRRNEIRQAIAAMLDLI